MPDKCFVAGCKSLYGTDVKQRKSAKLLPRPSLFYPPKDPELFNLWKEKIGRVDKELKPKSRVCEFHFPPEDILRFFETKMPDGSIHRIPRRPALKKNAVPTIFGSSNYLSIGRYARLILEENEQNPTPKDESIENIEIFNDLSNHSETSTPIENIILSIEDASFPERDSLIMEENTEEKEWIQVVYSI